MDAKTISRNFKHHPPTEPQILSHKEIRDTGKSFAAVIFYSTPESREQSLAITKIEEAVMWANAAIARDGQ